MANYRMPVNIVEYEAFPRGKKNNRQPKFSESILQKIDFRMDLN